MESYGASSDRRESNINIAALFSTFYLTNNSWSAALRAGMLLLEPLRGSSRHRLRFGEVTLAIRVKFTPI